MGEDRFFESLAEGAGVWRLLLVVIGVALAVFMFLRFVTPALTDRHTRKILLQGMSDETDSPNGQDEQRAGSVRKK